MVSFRKSLIALALLALCAGLASAATFTASCSTSGGTAVLRSEGVTELLNDVTVTCTDTTAGAIASGKWNITLYSTSTNITSAPGKNDGATGEIVMMAGGTVLTHGIIGANGLTVSFNNVVVPNTDAVPAASQGTFSFTVRGLRVNASTLTQGGPVFAAGVNLTFLAQPVNNLTPPGLFGDSPILNIANVAYAIPTFQFALVGGGHAFAQCSDSGDATPTADSPFFGTTFSVKFSETYSAAFKTMAQEEVGDTDATFVTNGTRLAATFSGLPGNTQLYVPVTAGSLSLVSGAKADGSGGTVGSTTGAIKAGNGTYWVAVTAGTPVVYEVMSSNLSVPEDFIVNVSVAYTGVPSLAAATSGSVTGNYAPVSGNPLASSGPIPRFSNAGAVTKTGLYGVAACSTSLLYPYITTQSGWAVGLAVSNTGLDPFGNKGQGGTCDFSFYGKNAPAAAVKMGAAGFGDTTVIAPGTTAADGAAAAVGSGVIFTGYAIAVCNFQYAHGYAFIVGNVPTGVISNGYLALVLQGEDSNRLRRGGDNGQYERTGF